tara:strand:+ start:65 stop:490 length:426 start_codon:yes stop_codon:yes gene_type:complete
MIKYQLICKKCDLVFNSWFASSKEFEKLKKMNLLSCASCNSFQIEKSVMSPRILSKVNYDAEKYNKKNREVKSKIREFQNYIEKNLDYVGENFSYEARSIHYSNKKNKRGIYGKASKKEIKELKEEGIETTMIPWLNDKEN